LVAALALQSTGLNEHEVSTERQPVAGGVGGGRGGSLLSIARANDL
jgi:hypothetical protein